MPDVLTASAPPLRPVKPLKTSYRIDSIDLLRGLVMIIMALDHTRDFFHKDAITDNPLNMATTTPILFFTRWITHFCAPVFVFLSGTSAWFQSFRKSKKQLSLFLIKRGVWLIFIEVVVFSFVFSFDPYYHLIGLQTLWSIGFSMILLGLIIWLPFPAILTIGLAIVLGHNSLDFYETGRMGAYPIIYSLMHHPGFYSLWDGHRLLVLYPFLPWTGLMILGYCFGKLFTRYEGAKRREILTWLGFGIILFFVALRATNLYGNPEHWSTQKNSLFTFLSFIDTHKYPPSLLFMCMTIGPAILFLAWFGDIKSGFSKIITVYGRVPFFYFVIHFFLIHLLTMILFLAREHSFAEGMKLQPGIVPQFIIPGEGYSLPVVYLIWLCVVASLYPVCKWFSDYKMKHREKWWLSYL
jgi:uncharacterized membrane protein